MKKFEITERVGIDEIINGAQVCTMSLIDNNKPYCVPMNFGYHDGIIYLHGAPFGRKIDALRQNPDVCISFYTDEAMNIRHVNVACSYSMKFKSVLVHGSVVFVDDNDEKARILNIVMKNYSGRDDFTYNKPALEGVCVFYVKPVEVTAFKRGY
jgi:nitroimidazol reductase NimA-like FMN-containing flavoprotein (pyridoxamine 5'-phosphate oxidase superfamily)